MSRRSTKYLKAALSALHYSGVGEVLSPLTSGMGAIFMLHNVSPTAPEAFSPNRILKITPEFLDTTIRQAMEAGFDLLSLDEVAARLHEPKKSERPFVAFTLDDAYRDNLEYAAPVFRRYGAPYTVYAPIDFVDGHGDLWWLALEKVIAKISQVECCIEGQAMVLRAVTVAEKDAAYHTIYWRLRTIDETVARSVVAELCSRAGLDVSTMCRELVLDWDGLRELASDPLVTIGGHTLRHYALAKLGVDAMQHEMAASVKRLETELGRPIRHFSFPFGDVCSAGEREFDFAREMGMLTAVTTRKGMIHARHVGSMTALPRVSLNGDYQDARYTKTLLSGAPFALYDLAKSFASRRRAA
jgi:peptidoglycan/xylan/chitin deacetylase (PgdA/CDA1 family)